MVERDFLLKEYDYLTEIQDLLRQKNVDRIKILLRMIGRTERRVDTYEKRLLRKLKEVGWDERDPVTFYVQGKQVSEKALEDHINIYARRIMLTTSRHHGSLSNILFKRGLLGLRVRKSIDWEHLKKEVEQVIEDVTALVAMLESMEIRHRIQNFEYLSNLIKSWSYRGNTGFFVRHWVSIARLQKELSDEQLRTFFGGFGGGIDLINEDNWPDIMRLALRSPAVSYGFEEIYPLLKKKIISWPQAVAGLGYIADHNPELARITYTKGLHNTLPFLENGISWEEFYHGLAEIVEVVKW